MTDYTFLPWVRRGVSRSLTGALTATSAARAALSVAVGVNGAPVGVPMTLHGPGDAIGIDRAAIARVDPVPGATDAEPFLFAAIELIPADLPWLLTPGGPDGSGRLLPWLALVVVPRDAGQISRVRRRRAGPARGHGCRTAAARRELGRGPMSNCSAHCPARPPTAWTPNPDAGGPGCSHRAGWIPGGATSRRWCRCSPPARRPGSVPPLRRSRWRSHGIRRRTKR